MSTISDLVPSTIKTNYQLNSLNVNTETPYTAFKLLQVNSQVSIDAINLIAQALMVSHNPVVTLRPFYDANNPQLSKDELNSREIFDNGYAYAIWIDDASESGTFSWKVGSMTSNDAMSTALNIGKTIKTAVLNVNGYCNSLQYSIKHDDTKPYEIQLDIAKAELEKIDSISTKGSITITCQLF